MHGCLHVIPKLHFDLGTLSLFASTLLSCHSFELIICEAKKLLHTIPSDENLRAGHDRRPNITRESVLCEEEVQRRRIFFACQSGPLFEGVESHVYVVRSVSAIISSRGPHEVRKGVQAQSHFRWFDVNTVDVEIVGALDFGPMEF